MPQPALCMQSPADGTMPSFSETIVVDPPSGILNISLVQSMPFEHCRIEQLPRDRFLTVAKVLCGPTGHRSAKSALAVKDQE
jgi:hypothetical protein